MEASSDDKQVDETGRGPGLIARFYRHCVDSLDVWERAKPKRAGRACYRAYTQLFIPFVILALFGLGAGGRELMWSIDGLNQYYPFFVYEGQWIRGIVGDLLSGQGLNVPLWAWNSGYGADVPTTFDVFFDPLNLVSAIVPEHLSEWAFQLLVIVRMYLAGLAFVFYCRTRGENRLGTVLGALMYALGGSGLMGVLWPSGLHAFMLFPVVLVGAEHVFAGKRPWVFVASLTCLAIVSYYFTYMACILLAGYLIVRIVMVERPKVTARRFLRWVGIFAGLVLLCLVLAAFSIVPAMFAILGMDRVTDGNTTPSLLYSFYYYLRTLTGFLSIYEVGADTHQGFGGLAFLACLLLFARKGENRELKIVLVVLTVCLLLPVIGSALNGFNYATNRWTWAYALCMSFVFARMTPWLLQLDARGKRILAVGVAAYVLVFVVTAARIEANAVGYAVLLMALAVLLVPQGQDTRRGLVTCVMALALGVNGFYFLSVEEGGKGTELVPFNVAYSKLKSASVDDLATLGESDSWWRYDAGQVEIYAGSPMNRVRNNSLVLGLNGIDFYSSIYNNSVDAFHDEMAITGDYINFSYTNLQGRTDLAALLGVRYYTLRNDGTDVPPAQFIDGKEVAQRIVANVDYRLLEANAYLPVGFTFDKSITRDEYLALTPAQRQQALLQAVVVEGRAEDDDATAPAGAGSVAVSSLEFEDRSIPFTIASTENVLVEDGRFVAQTPGASVTLSFEGTPNAETYLFVRGLKYEGLKPSDLVSDKDLADMTSDDRADLLTKDLYYVAPVFYEMSVQGDSTPLMGYIANFTPDNHMYGGKDTWLVNLGTGENAARTMRVSFSASGEYRFDDLQVITQTHDKLNNWISARNAEVLQDVNLGCNTLTGSIDVSAPKTLLLTIARGEGWSAYVDGEPTELLRADTAFMGIDLPAGHHEVELRYSTPGLTLGLSLTGAGVIALIILILVLRARTRHPSL